MSIPKKLLLVGSSHGAVHLRNYYHLIEGVFDEVLVVTETEIDYANFELANFSIKPVLKIPGRVKRIGEIICSFQPDIIHIHQANSTAFLTQRANKSKIPVLLTCWGSDVLLLPNKNYISKQLVKYVLKHSDLITVDALFMEQAIRLLGIEKEVEIANFGIEYKEVEIPEKQNIVYSNRLHKPLYNIDKIIEAFAEFHVTHPEWKLVIAANGSETEKLNHLASKLLNKHAYKFIGFVSQEENRKQYLKAKIWVSVPNSDGTAISLLEAMGYGCIPVVSNLPANLEWIDSNKNGIIVSDTLASSMDRATQMDLTKVQDINVKLILEKGTKSVNREIFKSLYDRLL